MFFYTIQEYDGTNITFKIMNDDSKLVTLNLQRDYLDYEFNTHYYKDKYHNIEKFAENVPHLYKNNKLYLKLDQFEFDRYSTKFPISSNGQVYKHLLNQYYRFYKNDL